jgi:hypothetical protein
VENRMASLRKETAALDAAATPLLRAINERGAWLRILDDLTVRLPPENIWITELAPTSGGRILGTPAAVGAAQPTPGAPEPGPGAAAGKAGAMIDGIFVRGLYLSNPKEQEIVVDYFRNLVGSQIFEVDPEKQSEVIKPSTPTSTEWAYPYELRLKLRQPIGLP